jgi:hypothetical protein
VSSLVGSRQTQGQKGVPKRSHLAAQLEFGSKTLITLRQGSDDATGEETDRSETPSQSAPRTR